MNKNCSHKWSKPTTTFFDGDFSKGIVSRYCLNCKKSQTSKKSGWIDTEILAKQMAEKHNQ